MTSFAMKGFKGKRVGSGHSHTPLEIRGHFHIQGPQTVGGDGGAPEWVYDLFKSNPKITQVAIGTETGGVVYSPIKE